MVKCELIFTPSRISSLRTVWRVAVFCLSTAGLKAGQMPTNKALVLFAFPAAPTVRHEVRFPVKESFHSFQKFFSYVK